MSQTEKLADVTMSADSSASSDSDILVGTTIGKYEVRHVVGAGGAGVVLAAYDAELGRSVAIKLLLHESEEARVRLVREAQAMAKLSHPNVVTVYEVLRVGERIAIVMELVSGRDLGAWQAEPRTWRQIVGVYVQAARGLAAAHRAGMVHRDFKPANALIDDDGVVRVTDFGLVRATDEVATTATARDEALTNDLTRTGAYVGTPAYMAPEQHTGGVVDARTDQWALACSLYGALYGQRPFAGDTPNAIRASVLAESPRVEPDTGVPKSIRAAIRRALSKERGDRFPTIEAFIHAITPRRRAWIAAAIAGGVGALGAGAIVFALAGGEGTPACTDLDAPMRQAWNPVRAAGIHTRLATAGIPNADRTIAVLDRYQASWIDARVRACVANQRGEESPELLDRKMSCLDQRLAEVDALAGSLAAAERSTLDQASSAVKDLHPIADCDNPRDLVPRPTDPVLRAEIARGEEMFARAWAMGELNNYAEAKPVAQEAVRIAERVGWQPLVARAQLQLGRSLSHEGDGAGAVAAADRAATAAAKARDDVTLADALSAKMFDVAATLGKPDDALAMRPYIELTLERAGQPPRLRAQWLNNLANAYFAKHQWDEALAAETASYNIARQFSGNDSAAVLDALSMLAVIETQRQNLDRAQLLLEQLLATETELHGPMHRTVALDYHNRGLLMINRKDAAAALADFERADQIDRAIGADSWETPLQLSAMQREVGRWRVAIANSERALAIAEKQAPGDSNPVGAGSMALAIVLLDVGELERAKPIVDRAIAAMRATKHPYLPMVLGEQARYFVASGKRVEAREAIRAAREAKGEPTPSIDIAEADLARLDGDWVRARAAYARVKEAAERDFSPASTTLATVGIAEADLAVGNPADALRALDERLGWLEAMHADPAAMAHPRFVLARALVASGGDRARAKVLAETARDSFGEPRRIEAAEAARWIAATFGK